MKNLYIDFDGVICDTITITYDMIKNEKIGFDDPKAIIKFYKELNWDKLLSITNEINDAFACIQTLVDSNKFNISILTHINSTDEAVAKVKYIRNYFKDITVIPVPKQISKTYMVHTEDAILVDDYPGNLIEWAEAGGVGIRFDLDKDGKGFKVIDRLDQLLDIFK